MADSTMKVARLHGPGEVRLPDEVLPGVVGVDDSLVKLTAASDRAGHPLECCPGAAPKSRMMSLKW
ncbi:hypothetical protein [Micromonospora sp. NPDC007230]|uniref:hypothetical protein n=1 Tax=Micromonospora sp. NPDC007230 TaxID=3364237 RepID=UPI0036B8509B